MHATSCCLSSRDCSRIYRFGSSAATTARERWSFFWFLEEVNFRGTHTTRIICQRSAFQRLSAPHIICHYLLKVVAWKHCYPRILRCAPRNRRWIKLPSFSLSVSFQQSGTWSLRVFWWAPVHTWVALLYAHDCNRGLLAGDLSNWCATMPESQPIWTAAWFYFYECLL